MCAEITESEQPIITKIPLVSPVVPLRNTSASSLFEASFLFFEAAFLNGCAKPHADIMRDFMDAAAIACMVYECDGAYSNDKMIWWHMQSCLPGWVLKVLSLEGEDRSDLKIAGAKIRNTGGRKGREVRAYFLI